MAVSQPILTPYGSTADAMLSGDPWVLIGGQTFVDSFSSELAARLETVADNLRKQTRLAAASDDLWAPYTEFIDVIFDGEEIMYALTGTAEQNAAMEDLEYGSPSNEPHPLLRNTLLGAIPQINRTIETRVDL